MSVIGSYIVGKKIYNIDTEYYKKSKWIRKFEFITNIISVGFNTVENRQSPYN